ncbi:uncharacterized protein LOC134197414 [Corticium candelabrum]|uniref:uncharacterized protein LOC134197414 n=1 Tax=Corticium candelabrum TaxID=121492 RepID=UPI002E26C5D9|nr:uncharacterized protein LOC134197414 [Corticium candelabrum]
MLPNRVQPSELFGSMSHNSDWSRDSQFSEPSSSQSLFSQTNSRSDYSQSLSQQPVGGEQTRTEDDNLQLNSCYLNYMSKPPLFKKSSHKSKVTSEPPLSEILKLKCQTQEKDNKAVFESLSSLVKQCTSEIQESLESIRGLVRSKFDAIESQSLRATSEMKDMITAQRNGIVEESAYRREQELKIEHLAKELALKDEKITALFRDFQSNDERRNELASLTDNMRECEKEIRLQRQLIGKEMQEAIMSIVSQLRSGSNTCRHTETVNETVHTKQIEKRLELPKAEISVSGAMNESPLLNITGSIDDCSASDHTVPSCERTPLGSDNVGYDGFFSPTSSSSSLSKLSNHRSERKSSRPLRHTKVVFVKSHSCKGNQQQQRHKVKPLSSRVLAQLDKLDEDTVEIGSASDRPASDMRDDNSVSVVSASSSATCLKDSRVGKGRTRQKRPLIVEPESDETARHMSKLGAMLSHRSRPN